MALSGIEPTGPSIDDVRLSKTHWKWTILSGMGDFLDAGSIVAGGVALVTWVHIFHMNTSITGLISAFSSNGISTAVGAIVAGFLGDKLGRKFIYNVDLLLYMIGALVIIFSVNAPMLIIGYMVLGFAVGADVPTSWSLIAEFAPKKSRGRLMGITNIFWYIGPIVMLFLALAFTHMGVLGMRLLFVVLLLAALITYLFRRSMVESPRWSALHGKAEEVKKMEEQVGAGSAPTQNSENSAKLRDLFHGKNLRRFLFLMPLYVFWGIPAGTYGFFFPYIFKTVGATSATTSDLMEILYFALAIISVLFIFMPLNDKVDRRILYAISAFLCGLAFLIPIFAPISNPYVAFANVVLFGLGQGIGLWPLQRIWSVELFPTEIRNTSQGILWGVMRVVLGLWSLWTPIILGAIGGFKAVALLMVILFAYNFVVGGLFGPRTGGKSLEEINV